MKILARKVGITHEELLIKTGSGMKWCYQCREWKTHDCFNTDNCRYDKLTSKCKLCRCGHGTKAEKISRALKGRISTFKGKRHSDSAKQAMSDRAKGHKRRVGKRHTEETKKRISMLTKERTPRGEKHYAFSHGQSQRNFCDRRTIEYKQWRLAVFERDGYTCKKCGDNTGGNLRAHHIKSFAEFPDMRFVVSNGITLCHDCHELEHFKPESTRNLRKAKRGRRLY